MTMIKVFEDGEEKETLRFLGHSQVEALKNIFDRHGIKYDMRNDAL